MTPHWWTGGTMLQDFRGQMSWGRVCSMVALGMACKLSFAPHPDVALVTLWLGAAVGNYTASKITEMVTAKRVTETGGV